MARRRRRKWDWADALEKMLRITLRRQDVECPDNVNAATMRRLAARQRNCCALSGMSLAYPETSELPTHTCLNKWRAALEQRNSTDAACSPDLVRANPLVGWVPGNILLIAHRYYDLYSSVNGLAEFRTLCEHLSAYKTVIPQAEALLPTPAEIAMAHEAKARQIREDEHI